MRREPSRGVQKAIDGRKGTLLIVPAVETIRRSSSLVTGRRPGPDWFLTTISMTPSRRYIRDLKRWGLSRRPFRAHSDGVGGDGEVCRGVRVDVFVFIV
jgi:hypothetical protein